MAQLAAVADHDRDAGAEQPLEGVAHLLDRNVAGIVARAFGGHPTRRAADGASPDAVREVPAAWLEQSPRILVAVVVLLHLRTALSLGVVTELAPPGRA